MTAPARKIYVSTCSFETLELPALLGICRDAGIDAIELSSVRGYDSRLVVEARAWASLVVHNYFPPPARPFLLNLASQDPENLARSRQFCREAIALGAELGSPVYGVHAGFAVDIPPGLLGRPEQQTALLEGALPSAEALYATTLESVRDLNQYAKERGVKLLVENNVVSPLMGPHGHRLLPMSRADELVRLAKDVADPNFGLLLDVGHAKVSATACNFDRDSFVEEIAPYVGGLHLSDNDGISDQNAPFGKEAWFMKYVSRFKSATVTLELAKLSPDRILAVRDAVMEEM